MESVLITRIKKKFNAVHKPELLCKVYIQSMNIVLEWGLGTLVKWCCIQFQTIE